MSSPAHPSSSSSASPAQRDAQTTSTTNPSRSSRLAPFDAFWRALHQPWLLLCVGGIALLLLLGEQFFPQLPTQLADNPAAAERWLISAGANYGALGDILLTLGMFDLRHSLLLRIVLAFVALLLAVRLADQIGAALQMRQVQQRFGEPPLLASSATSGQPLDLPMTAALYRFRRAFPVDPVTLGTRAATFLQTRFSHVEQQSLARPDAAQTEQSDSHGQEPFVAQFLATRHRRSAYLRPLLFLGLLLGLFVAWLSATFGWTITLSSLGPGETVRYAPQGLEVSYLAPAAATPSSSGQTANLQVQVGNQTETISVTTRTHARLHGVDLHAAIGPPGLLIRSGDDADILTVPGQSNASSHIGLVLSTAGDEEFVLVPGPAIVLRILRGVDENEPFFLIEVFEGLAELAADTVQPAQRLEVRHGQAQTVELRDGDIVLHIVPLPSLRIEARYLPGIWLLLPALALVIAGAAGYGRPPVFLLLQVAPWPPDRTVVVAQSNARTERRALESWLTTKISPAMKGDAVQRADVEPEEASES